MFTKLSFRAKLLLVLFVPFLALVVVAAAGLGDRFSDLRAQEQYGTLVSPLRSLDELSLSLQNEAVATAWYLSSGRSGAVPIQAARSRTDAAIEQFRANAPSFMTVEGSAADLAVLDDRLADLRRQRRGIDASPVLNGAEILLATDDVALDFGESVARNLHDRQVAASVSRSLSLRRENGELAREASVLMLVITGRSSEGFSDWVGAIAAQARYERQFVTGASPDELRAFTAGIDSREPGTSLIRLPATITLPNALPDFPADPAAYFEAYRNQAGAIDTAGHNVDAVIARVSSERADAARGDVWTYGGVAIFAMLLTLLLIWFVTRAVVRPVRKLTAAARDMSDRRLPQLVESLRTGGDVTLIEPVTVEVSSEDEIGELARAFNQVEAVTTQVALEQSRLLRTGMGELFVNLARRNQSLLERQLELLDDLERNEHDPRALDALFKLDHMATRMRRNAESLLVLSGSEQPRQWQEPIAVVDVVRAAAAEIADFPRVELRGLDQALAVAGRVVTDLAHLLAELLENATSFSPPDAAVVVSGGLTEHGFVLAIADKGIGLPPERLAAGNALLRHPPVVGLALSRALGLHVVGLLAARHGISVLLRPASPHGTVAMVLLPNKILEDSSASEPLAPMPVSEAPPETAPPTSRRTGAWRPDDEPPVEEWRREGLVTANEAMPVNEPVSDPLAADEPALAEATTPPLLRTETAVSASGVAPPLLGADPIVSAAAPPHPADDDSVHESARPLPSRVPGHHLSHQPTTPADIVAAVADPLRPHHVQDLLTRHQMGKRRGQAEAPVTEPARSPDSEDDLS